MATVVIKLDGVDITADVVFAQPTNFRGLADGQPGTAVVLVDDEQQAYTPDDIRAGMTLELFIDGQREWDGWAFKVRRAWPLPVDDTSQPATVPRFWIIEGYDRNILFQKRFMYRIDDPSNNEGFTIWPTDTSDKQAIDFALNNYVDLSGDDLDIESGIKQVASPGPFEEFTLGYVSAPLGVLFEDAAQITGAVFYIDPDRVIRYVDDVTVTAPFVLSDAPIAGQVGYREVEAARDYTQAGNEALVWGAGRGSAEPVFAKYTDTDRVALHGLWQYGEVYVGAWKQQTVNRRARTYVEGSPGHRRGHNDPVPVVTCSLFTPGIRTGHVVDFRMTTYDYQEALPVRSSTITFLSPTEPRWDLELTLRIDTPFGIPDLWKLKFPPPFDISETIPPEGPGGVGGVPVDRLIDHFDVPIAPYVTPGPEITGAPWPGGNEWIISDRSPNIPDPPSWEIVNSKATVYSQDFLGDVTFTLLSAEYYLVDDLTGTLTSHAGVQQGDWASDYGEGAIVGPTPWGPWQHPPSTLTWKVRLSDLSADEVKNGNLDEAVDAHVYIDHAFTVFDDGPDLAYWGSTGVKTAWRGTYEVLFEAFRDGDFVGAFIEVHNTMTSFDRGIMHLAVPDTTADWEIGTWPDPGMEWFTKVRAWHHIWGKVFDYADIVGSDYYIKTHVGEIVHPEGGIEFKVKIWKVGTTEPDWMYEDIIAMCKGNATTYLGYAHEGATFLGTQYMSDMLRMLVEGWSWDVAFGDPPPFNDQTSVDAIWALTGGTGTGSIATNIPIYDNAEHAEAQYYITQYPYAAGSLVVYFQGIRLRPNVDYIETDPTTGEFRILGDRDVSSSLLVKYTRAGSVPTSSGGEVYRPAPQLQYGWGTPMDGYNALFACSAMALDRHTLGANTAFVGTPRNTPPNHRGFQADQSTGGGLDDVETAWSAGWGETFYGWGIQSWSAFVTHIDARQGAVLQGIYSNLPASKRLSNFTGAHAIYINERFANGNFWGIDPLYRYPTLYTTDELKAYAAGIVIGADTVGYGSVSAGYTKVT